MCVLKAISSATLLVQPGWKAKHGEVELMVPNTHCGVQGWAPSFLWRHTPPFLPPSLPPTLLAHGLSCTWKKNTWTELCGCTSSMCESDSELQEGLQLHHVWICQCCLSLKGMCTVQCPCDYRRLANTHLTHSKLFFKTKQKKSQQHKHDGLLVWPLFNLSFKQSSLRIISFQHADLKPKVCVKSFPTGNVTTWATKCCWHHSKYLFVETQHMCLADMTQSTPEWSD